MATICIRLKKLHNRGDIGSIGNHCSRLNTVHNSDPEKRKYNKLLVGSEDALVKWKDIAGDLPTRKNAVLAIDAVVSVSNGSTFLKDKIKTENWCNDVTEWLASRFGGHENLVQVTLHRDEKTPHIHALIAPIVADGGKLKVRSLCATRFLGRGRRYLSEFQTDLADAVGNKYELERGNMHSMRDHLSPDKYREYIANNINDNIRPHVSIPPLLLKESLRKKWSEKETERIHQHPAITTINKYEVDLTQLREANARQSARICELEKIKKTLSDQLQSQAPSGGDVLKRLGYHVHSGHVIINGSSRPVPDNCINALKMAQPRRDEGQCASWISKYYGNAAAQDSMAAYVRMQSYPAMSQEEELSTNIPNTRILQLKEKTGKVLGQWEWDKWHERYIGKLAAAHINGKPDQPTVIVTHPSDAIHAHAAGFPVILFPDILFNKIIKKHIKTSTYCINCTDQPHPDIPEWWKRPQAGWTKQELIDMWGKKRQKQGPIGPSLD